VSWGKVNPGVLPDTVVSYVDSTIAFPLFCEYACAHKNGRRKRKALVHEREAMVANLKAEAINARKPQPSKKKPARKRKAVLTRS
jgi:hypothetical protein